MSGSGHQRPWGTTAKRVPKLDNCKVAGRSKGWITYGQPAHGAVTRAVARQAVRWGSIPGVKKASFGQFNRAPSLHQRVSPYESEHTLRIAPKAKAEASLYRQKPGNWAAGVSTGVAPETMGSLTSRDLRVDGTPIRGDLLFAMREPPAPQGEPQRMARGIGKVIRTLMTPAPWRWLNLLTKLPLMSPA